ncbi:MAG TPA: urease accessory UreF family protein [Verrucomicrobiae bacterium]|nr:urease accessory UreF family protein [Verrucomicrobiae bacterium]
MAEQIHPAFEAANVSVDARPLTEQLGSADELTTLSPTACSHQLTKVHSLPALRDFLRAYSHDVLGPHEFRHIYEAFNFAGQSFTRELLALDLRVAAEPVLQGFKLASSHVGKRQLNRMRALKDLRTLQRYREAVNDGKAHGWHTLVYGVVLSTYSLPLRQGLLHYGRQTLRGFIYSAARSLDLRDEACLELQVELNSGLASLIEKTLGASGHSVRVL